MHQAMNLYIEDLADKSRLFNLTDELLGMSSGYPGYDAKFQQLGNMLLAHVMQQHDVRQLISPRGIYYIKGLGIATCHFESLSVYHFLRMSQEPIADVKDHFNEVHALANRTYVDGKFRTGPLSAKEEDIRLYHFQPNNRAGYRVDHMMQVLHHNRHHQQQYIADMSIVTAAGGQNA